MESKKILNDFKRITTKEFQYLFCEYDFSDINDVCSNLLTELREIIQKYQLNLKDIFVKFD
jgi:hypothetical protein